MNEIVELIKLGNEITILAKEKEENIFHKKVAKYNLLNKTIYSPVYKFNKGRYKLLIFIIKLLFDFVLHPFRTALRFKLLISSQKNMWYAIDSYFSIEKVFGMKFDLIQTGFSTSHIIDNAYLLSRILNVPFVLMFRAYELYRKSDLKKLNKRINIVKHASSVVTISYYNRDYIKTKFNIRNIPVVHDSIDVNLFKPMKNKNTKRIISIGRFVDQKGFSYLVKACNILDKRDIDFELVFIGIGPNKKKCEKLVKEYKLSNVFFKDSLPSDKVKLELGKSSIFVLPCVVTKNGNRDILANVLKEAMAMEIPIITSDICGVDELVEHEISGLLVPPKDPEAIANAIEKLLKHPELRKKMGAAGHKKIIKDFNIKKEVKKLEKILQMAINSK
ncbi:MAG: glycosyltransferase family 4 protein [DPANN group archaeon]|nr:glycosyltransferase family 4 protein [DPANN group archaeon]